MVNTRMWDSASGNERGENHGWTPMDTDWENNENRRAKRDFQFRYLGLVWAQAVFFLRPS
jgi:hypothetical protein